MKPPRDIDPDRPIGQSDLLLGEGGNAVIIESHLVSTAVVPTEGISARRYMEPRYAAERKRTVRTAAGWILACVGAGIFMAAASQRPLSAFDIVATAVLVGTAACLFWASSRVRMPRYAAVVTLELGQSLTQRDAARLQRTAAKDREALITVPVEARPGD